ncbi:MAG: 30S ribosomal protein S16 [Bacteroidales bacterium]
MPVKIRLARHGKKSYAFYHIVVADSRAPRDGKFIERIGSYNPNTNPASVDVDFDRALTWLQTGAQPTETVKRMLSEKGVLLKKHLLEGAKKGAFSVDEAEVRFSKWMADKSSRVAKSNEAIQQSAADAEKARLEAESKAREAIAQKVARKLAAASGDAAEESAEESSEGAE